MGQSRLDKSLDPVLEHPAIWRGRSLARIVTHSTGWSRLDEALPGGGWPAAGLIELLTPRPGLGELRLLIPLLARLSQVVPARWVAWVSPPFEPYAPALQSQGVPPEHQLVIRTHEPLWALEQALESGACATVLGWPGPASWAMLRRLQVATQRCATPAFVFREDREASRPSPAMLRIVVAPCAQGAQLTLLKSRGGARSPFTVSWTTTSEIEPHGAS